MEKTPAIGLHFKSLTTKITSSEGFEPHISGNFIISPLEKNSYLL